MKKIIKIISDLKDWVVKDNKGLHFSLAYIWFDIVYMFNINLAFITTIFFIIALEIIDKYGMKTKFSLIDISYGILGMLLCYMKILSYS